MRDKYLSSEDTEKRKNLLFMTLTLELDIPWSINKSLVLYEVISY